MGAQQAGLLGLVMQFLRREYQGSAYGAAYLPAMPWTREQNNEWSFLIFRLS